VGDDSRACERVGEAPGCLDVAFLIDASRGAGGSFAQGAEAPSLLSAEVELVRQLLARLDPRRVAVTVIGYAGVRRPSATLPMCWVEVGLTNDFDLVGRGLARLESTGPRGRLRHMASGIDLGTVELLGLRGAVGSPAPRARKASVLLAVGPPLLPGQGPDGVRNAVRRAADRARRGSIAIDAVALGDAPDDTDAVLGEVARTTGGAFYELRDGAQLSALSEELARRLAE
jgi:hypothetical protein